MYLPKHFEELNETALLELIAVSPLATLILVVEGRITANHIPMLWDSGSPGDRRLIAHIPRSNPLSKVPAGTDALAIFHGPECYITPGWYPAKRATRKVVPTWNYQVVHAHGTEAIIDDPAWVHRQVGLLTQQAEARRSSSWQLSDAPEPYISTQMRALVGVEFNVRELIGKTKASQNQAVENKEGVIEGLEGTGIGVDAAMADIIRKGLEGTGSR